MSREWFVGLVIAIGLLLVGPSLAEMAIYFIIAGRIPVINLVVPPIAMIIFWATVLPIAVVSIKLSKVGLWNLIERIGEIHQRQINRRIRWWITSNDLLNLLVAIHIYRLSKLVVEKPSDNKLSFTPRRFIALPA